jgi:hypothetical protein
LASLATASRFYLSDVERIEGSGDGPTEEAPRFERDERVSNDPSVDPISPELALVDPELVVWARKQLPDLLNELDQKPDPVLDSTATTLLEESRPPLEVEMDPRLLSPELALVDPIEYEFGVPGTFDPSDVIGGNPANLHLAGLDGLDPAYDAIQKLTGATGFDPADTYDQSLKNRQDVPRELPQGQGSLDRTIEG